MNNKNLRTEKSESYVQITKRRLVSVMQILILFRLQKIEFRMSF